MVVELPLELPPVKLKLNVAVEQLWKASVAVPTMTLFGVVGASNTPPVVSKIFIRIEREPGTKALAADAVYQRCPAAPAPAPVGA